jgi:hypothetical protein
LVCWSPARWSRRRRRAPATTRSALTQAIRTNGRGGVKKAKSALKTLNHAVDMVASGARKIHG